MYRSESLENELRMLTLFLTQFETASTKRENVFYKLKDKKGPSLHPDPNHKFNWRDRQFLSGSSKKLEQSVAIVGNKLKSLFLASQHKSCRHEELTYANM